MKKFFKYFGICFLIVVLLAGVFFLQGLYRLDVNFFEINRVIKSGSNRWGTQVTLIPDIFAIGENFEQVDKSLKLAGYEHVPNDKVWKRYEDRAGSNKFVYTREASNLVCNIKLYVFLEFEEYKTLKTLKSATGTQHEHGCL